MSRKILSLTLSISLLFQYSGFAQSINLADYLSQGHNVVALDRFRPLALRYFSYEPSVNNFKILLDKGDQKDLSDAKIKDEADRLLTYFKIGLTLPNEKFWVNLRPDAEDQIIDPELEKTDLGKVLLESDLQLKKDTSSLTSPQSKEGKIYWDKLYKKAGELFGTENITIPTLTRPWIVPGEIIVRESKDSAYIYKAVLKVMLEEDYLKSSQLSAIGNQQYEFNDPRLKELNQYSTQLIRELILPKLTQKVNSSKDYANLRQVYFSLILARWFKDNFGSSGSTRAPEHQSQENSYIRLIDSGDLTNLTSKEAWSKTAYFNEYKKSFAQGEYNLSEKVYTPTGQVIRRYTSGGLTKLMTFTKESFVGNSSPVTRKDMVALTVSNIGKQEQIISSPLQKRRLEEVIPIIEKILEGISLRKSNEKGPPSRYSFKINKIEEDTLIKGSWKPTKDNSLAENLNVWHTRNQEMAGLNHYSLAGPYVKIDYILYILYVIPGKTTGVDLIKAVSLIIEDEGMSDEIKKDFEKAIKNTTGVSLSNPINAKKPKKGAGSPITNEASEDAGAPKDKVGLPLTDFDLKIIGLKAEIIQDMENFETRFTSLLKKYKLRWYEWLSDGYDVRKDLYGLTEELSDILQKIKINFSEKRDPLESSIDLADFINSGHGSISPILQKIDTILKKRREEFNHRFKTINIDGSFNLKIYYYQEWMTPTLWMNLPKDIEPMVNFMRDIDKLSDEFYRRTYNTSSEIFRLLQLENTVKLKKGVQKYITGPSLLVSGPPRKRVEQIIIAYLLKKIDFAQAIEKLKSSSEYLHVESLKAILFVLNLAEKYDFTFKIIDDFVAYLQVKISPDLTEAIPGRVEELKEELRKIFTKQPSGEKIDVELVIKKIIEEGEKIMSVSSSLAQIEKPEVVGGIDLRQMNMLIQPQGSFASSSLDFSLPALSKAEIEAFDLDKELELIQRMASSGIDPIDERLKKYLAVCFARGKTGKEIDELKLCLEDVFTAQQLDARETPDGYKEVIVIADTRRFVLKESRLAAGKSNVINLN